MKTKTKQKARAHRSRIHHHHPRAIEVGGKSVHRWSPVFEATHQLVAATLDIAEAAVADVPEEREKVRNVRVLAECRFAGRTAPEIDPRDIAFTIGVVATLAESDFAKPGISSLLLELLPLTRPQPRERRRRGSATRGSRPAQPKVVWLCNVDDFHI